MAKISALYCHIPFCHTICPFCAFAVHGNRMELHRPYLDALKWEITQAGAGYDGARQNISSLYMGGGTPSILGLSAVEDLLGHIRAHFPFTPDIEIAFEVNPEDATPEYLRGLSQAGVNRVSLGLQSLDDATLRMLRRNHNAESGWTALEALRAEGPRNYNVDLMFAVPNAPDGAFLRDLEAVAAARPPHLSLYGLDLEPGTLFARDASVVEWVHAQGASQAGIYLQASRILTGLGYRHYEVSNFCLPGRQGRQNLAVWTGQYYLGFGTGAHSYVDGVRWRNHRHLKAYLRMTGEGATPNDFAETLTRQQMANEDLMLALRQDTGLDVPAWEARWGTSWCNTRQSIARTLVKEGKARLNEGRLALTPEGFLVADEATAMLMVE